MMKKDYKNINYKNIIKSLIVVILLVVLFYKMDIELVICNLKSINYINMILAFFFVAFSFILSFIKWKLFLPELAWIDIIKGIVVMHSLSYVAGGQVIGEGGKVIVTKDKGIPLDKVVTSVFADKISSLRAVFTVGLYGLWVVRKNIELKILYLLLFFSILGVVFSVLIFNNGFDSLIINILNRYKNKDNRIYKVCHNFFKNMMYYANNHKITFVNYIISIILQLDYVFITYILISGLGYHISFGTVCAIFELSTLAGLIPLSAFGIGASQFSTVGLLVYIGISPEGASAYVILNYFLMIIFALIGMPIVFLVKNPTVSD